MNIKRFQKVARVLSWLLNLFNVIVMLFIVYVGLYLLGFGQEGSSFNYAPDISGVIISVSQSSSSDGLVAANHLGNGLAAIFSSLLIVFNYHQGSLLFAHLADGESPFSKKFVQRLKRISIVFFINGVFEGLLYPLLVKFIISPLEYSIVFGVSNSIVYGLFFYVIAGVLNYGLELQALADDIV